MLTYFHYRADSALPRILFLVRDAVAFLRSTVAEDVAGRPDVEAVAQEVDAAADALVDALGTRGRAGGRRAPERESAPPAGRSGLAVCDHHAHGRQLLLRAGMAVADAAPSLRRYQALRERWEPVLAAVAADLAYGPWPPPCRCGQQGEVLDPPAADRTTEHEERSSCV